MDNIEDFKRLCEVHCKNEDEIKEMTELRRKIKNRVSQFSFFFLFLKKSPHKVLDVVVYMESNFLHEKKKILKLLSKQHRVSICLQIYVNI